MSLDLKVSIFNSQNRCNVVVPDELGRELEHFNWLCLGLLSPTTTQILYSQFTSLQCRRILGGRNLVRGRNVVVAAIFDFMTVKDWGE